MPEASTRRLPRFVFLSDAPIATNGGRHFGWRLTAANNRPLGRAVAAAVSLDDCRASAADVRAGIVEARHVTSMDLTAGYWTWWVSLNGVPVAVCTHAYLRRIECVRGLDYFVQGVAVADPALGVIRYFGPRSLRGYLPAAATPGPPDTEAISPD